MAVRLIRLAWRRALVKRSVCKGAPSCINCILPLFCRWGMQTGERNFRLNTSRHSGYPLPPHIVFLSCLLFSKLHLEGSKCYICIFCKPILLKIGMHFANSLFSTTKKFQRNPKSQFCDISKILPVALGLLLSVYY